MRLIGHTAPWRELRDYTGPRAEFTARPSHLAKSREVDPEMKSWVEVMRIQIILLPRLSYYYGYRLSFGDDQHTIHYLDRPLIEEYIAPRMGPEQLIGVLIPVDPTAQIKRFEAVPKMILRINDERHPYRDLMVP